MTEVFYDGGTAGTAFSTTDGVINYALPLGQVRLLILDTADLPADRLFTDAQLDALYHLNNQSVLRTASAALMVVATSENLLGKKIRTAAGTSTDGPAVSAELRSTARELLARARAEEAEAAESTFEFVAFGPTDGLEGVERGIL